MWQQVSKIQAFKTNSCKNKITQFCKYFRRVSEIISSQIDTQIVYNFSCHPNSDQQQLENLPQLVTSFHPQLNEWSLHSHQSFLSQPLRADLAMIHVPFRIPVVPMQFVQWQDQILFVPVRQDLAAFPGMAFLIHHTDV